MAKRLIRKGEKQPGGLPLVDVKRGVEMVQTAKYALFTSPQSTYVTIFETFTNGEICTLYSLTKPDYSLIAAPAMSKNSSMKQVGYYGLVAIFFLRLLLQYKHISDYISSSFLHSYDILHV